MKKFNEAVELINSQFNSNEHFFDGPYSKEEIEAAEQILSVIFPKSYRSFLKKYGNGGVNSLDVNGLSRHNYNNTGLGGIVYKVLKQREDFAIPHHILVISDMGDGSAYALDLSQMNNDNECPVVVWPIGGYEMTPVLEIVAPDFGTWFLDKVKQQIQWKNEDS